MAIQYIFNKYLHYVLHAANVKPLSQQKRNSPSSWSLMTCIEDRPYPKNHTTIRELWTVMKAKKESYTMLGASTAGEMGPAEQWNWPQSRKKKKGGRILQPEGTCMMKGERTAKNWKKARQPEPRKLGAMEASLVGCRGQTWEGLECIRKATASHRKLLS